MSFSISFAAFHSLVGLAAVMVAAAVLYSPSSFGIGNTGSIHGHALFEMAIDVIIGAAFYLFRSLRS